MDNWGSSLLTKAQCRHRVKIGNALMEQMFSGLPSTADVARRSDGIGYGPGADSCSAAPRPPPRRLPEQAWPPPARTSARVRVDLGDQDLSRFILPVDAIEQR